MYILTYLYNKSLFAIDENPLHFNMGTLNGTNTYILPKECLIEYWNNVCEASR